MTPDDGIDRGGRRLIAAGVVCGLIAAFAGSPAIAQQALSGSDIRALMAGSTIELEMLDRLPTEWEIGQDGRLAGEKERARSMDRDDGKWWISDSGSFCYQWRLWDDSETKCREITVAGKNLNFILGDGSVVKWSIRKFGPRARQIAFGARQEPRLDRQAKTRDSRPETQDLRAKTAPVSRPKVALDNSPPTIEAPRRIEAEGAVVIVKGRVSDASQIAETTIDGRPFSISAAGRFEIKRVVPVGRSVLRIEVLDEWANAATHEIVVTRQARSSPPVVASRALPPGPKSADPFAGIQFGNYHALVIGNNEYPAFPDLNTAVRDAEAVGRLLERSYGFKVTPLINATRVQIIGALAKMRATLTVNDSLLIYYAGHGVIDEVTQQGYWLPVDSHQDNPANWISTDDITTMLKAMSARHVMVVADSCYSGTLVRAAPVQLETAREKYSWLKRVVSKRARTALVSGGLEPVLDSGGGEHSVFAKAFLDALSENTGVMEGQALFDAIKRPVVLNSDQTPQYADIRKAGHDGGEFLFVRR